MSLSFKKASETDVPIISALANNIWRKHYLPIIGAQQVDYMMEKMYASENILQQMKDQQQYTLVLDKGTPIGYMSVSTKDNKNYLLHKLYVEVSERRKGTGAQLLNHILDSYKTLETLELTVNRQNYKAINFYFKQGFVIKEVADFDIGNGYFMNDFVMIATVDRLRSALKLTELTDAK